MTAYENIMEQTLSTFTKRNKTSVFGDIFLEDLRNTGKQLEKLVESFVFPLWKKRYKSGL